MPMPATMPIVPVFCLPCSTHLYPLMVPAMLLYANLFFVVVPVLLIWSTVPSWPRWYLPRWYFYWVMVFFLLLPIVNYLEIYWAPGVHSFVLGDHSICWSLLSHQFSTAYLCLPYTCMPAIYKIPFPCWFCTCCWHASPCLSTCLFFSLHFWHFYFSVYACIHARQPCLYAGSRTRATNALHAYCRLLIAICAALLLPYCNFSSIAYLYACNSAYYMLCVWLYLPKFLAQHIAICLLYNTLLYCAHTHFNTTTALPTYHLIPPFFFTIP